MGETSTKEQEIWDKLFRPEILNTFFDPYPQTTDVSISVFTRPEGPATETIKIDSFFPFSTIDDLKLAIYTQKGKDPAYSPEYQFLAIPWAEAPAPGQRAKRYMGLDFYFKKGNISLFLEEPFKAATAEKWNEDFVDSEGNRKILEGASRGRTCFEDLLIKPYKGTIPAIHLFLLRDILAAIRLPKPLSQPQHNGRILTYFPSTTPEMDGTRLSEKQKEDVESLSTYYISKQKIMLERLVPLLEEFTFGNFPKIKDVKYLRFVWLQKSSKKALDTLFYETPVSHSRPFMRFYPADNVAINKLQVKGVLPIPDIVDPCLLLQWAKEKSPTTERDFLLGKITIQQLFEGTTPVYATLQAVDDGTAAIIVEPPKPVKRLDPLTDLKLLKESIKKGIQGFPFENNRVDIDEANMVAVLRLEGIPKMTAKDISKRLQVFRGFFREIPPLEGETPILALRYKAVSNFFREDAVGTYLTELASRHVLNPATAFEDMVSIIAEEFSLTKEQARASFNKWKDTKEDIVPLQPEYDLYKLKYNPGIDILIYAQHPDYFFHLYRVDSYINLRRVLTLLTMMFSIPKDDLGIEEKQVKVVVEAAEKSIPAVGDKQAEGIVGATALAVQGIPKPNAVAVELLEDTGDVGDAADIDDWDFFENEQESTPEALEESVSPVKATTLVKEAQGVPTTFKPTVLPPTQKEVPQEIAAKQSSKLGVPTANYFIRKLQEADSRLFEYTKGIKGLKKYVSACAANEHRQPAVLDQGGYDRMMLEYRPDMERDEIDIITYGFEKAEVSLRKSPLPYKSEKEKEEHTFMVLKYGTDITNQKYYLCSEFFCLRDEIIVRKDEFEGTKFRANADPELVGKRKEPNRCPFCNGKLIKNYPEVGEGETVFPREVNISNKIKKHTHIGFYSKKLHPEGFGLPCCFTSKQTITSADPWFNPLKEMSRRLRKAGAEFEEEEELEEEEEEEQGVEIKSGMKVPNYQDTLQRVYRKYIVGPEKMPLEIGDEPQIGLLPPALNEYFKQNISDLTQRAQIRQELKADAKGFLRIGVDNRGGHRAESFFAAIAPFLLLNSADQVRYLMKTKITPRVFLSANYGNLMMEFYDPRVPARKTPLNEIRDWSSIHLKIKGKTPINYLTRIYHSYINFWGDEKAEGIHAPSFLDDKSKIKEYRQFASLLAQANIITPRGILFIVLDIQPDGSVKVICPPYGYNESMRNADIGILLHQGDIWEPIFYSSNSLPTATEPAKHTYTLRFQKAVSIRWPPILIKRAEEFRTQCKGPDVGQYTGLQAVAKGAKLMNLTTAIRIFPEPFSVYGIVRDTYNHVVACIFNISPDPDSNDTKLVAFPVADDGVIHQELQIYQNWDGFTPAPIDIVVEFYTKQIMDVLSVFPALAASYKPVHYIIPQNKEKITAIQLANNIFIPVGPPEKIPIEKLGLSAPKKQPQEIEWDINKKITFSEGREVKLDIMKTIESEKQLEEIFEHFRLTFSDWLAGPNAGPQLRTEIHSILFPQTVAVGIDLPVYEKRKRLQMLLSPFLTKWMDDSEPGPKPFESLLRVDCTNVVVADKCKSPCVWAKHGETQEACYIHTPRTEEKSMNTPEIFLARLIEELIRFPMRRAEIMKENKKHVSHLVSLKSAVRIGDTLVVPEDSMEWTDLLRLECRKVKSEQPHYFEEISNKVMEVEEMEEVEPVDVSTLGLLPDALKNILGPADSRTNDLALYEWDRSRIPVGTDLNAVVKILDIPASLIEIPPEKREFSLPELGQMAGVVQKGVVQINLDSTEPTRMISGWTFGTSNTAYILVKQGDTMKFLITKTQGLGPIKEEFLPEPFLEKIKKLFRRKT